MAEKEPAAVGSVEVKRTKVTVLGKKTEKRE
jgi:hypothetical protein